MNDLQAYKLALNNTLITGVFELEQKPGEERTAGFDEYLDARNIVFKDCTIRNITMTSSNFSECTFENCIFEGGSIVGCVFETCNILSLTLRDVHNSCTFTACTVQELNFENGWEKI